MRVLLFSYHININNFNEIAFWKVFPVLLYVSIKLEYRDITPKRNMVSFATHNSIQSD